ncbi:hypothetical protein F5Y17DRAFT_228128 [Xylariaceae sp. FL0594]|nr:hypothetical protein F5Y17DRAFT_228128 [Xylariaceae sp. FL0594]
MTMETASALVKESTPITRQPAIQYTCREQTEAFCYSVGLSSPNTYFGAGGWRNHDQTAQYLETISTPSVSPEEQQTPSSDHFTFNFIGGYGNGTLYPLSIDRVLFESIITTWRLPNRL